MRKDHIQYYKAVWIKKTKNAMICSSHKPKFSLALEYRKKYQVFKWRKGTSLIKIAAHFEFYGGNTSNSKWANVFHEIVKHLIYFLSLIVNTIWVYELYNLLNPIFIYILHFEQLCSTKSLETSKCKHFLQLSFSIITVYYTIVYTIV